MGYYYSKAAKWRCWSWLSQSYFRHKLEEYMCACIRLRVQASRLSWVSILSSQCNHQQKPHCASKKWKNKAVRLVNFHVLWVFWPVVSTTTISTIMTFRGSILKYDVTLAYRHPVGSGWEIHLACGWDGRLPIRRGEVEWECISAAASCMTLRGSERTPLLEKWASDCQPQYVLMHSSHSLVHLLQNPKLA